MRKHFFGPLTGVPTTAGSVVLPRRQRRRRLVAFRRQRQRLAPRFTVSYRNYRARDRTVVIDRIPRLLNTAVRGEPIQTGETVDVSPRVPQRSICAHPSESTKQIYTYMYVYI